MHLISSTAKLLILNSVIAHKKIQWNSTVQLIEDSHLSCKKKQAFIFFIKTTARLPVPGHFYSCVVSKYLLREKEISFLLL